MKASELRDLNKLERVVRKISRKVSDRTACRFVGCCPETWDRWGKASKHMHYGPRQHFLSMVVELYNLTRGK